jgi:hypothetical protein
MTVVVLAMGEEHEVKYWTKHLRVSKEKLQEVAMQREYDQLSLHDIEGLENELMIPVEEIGAGIIAAIFVLLFFWGLPKFVEAAPTLVDLNTHVQSVAYIGPG